MKPGIVSSSLFQTSDATSGHRPGKLRAWKTSHKNELTQFIGLTGEPSALVDLKTLSLPIGFRQRKPDEFEIKFPCGQNLTASIYVVKQRGLSFDTIDFCFGGNTLNFLVNQDVSDGPFYTTKIPGTKTLVVVKGKHYTANFSEFGFQFERLVTGRAMESNGDHSTVEHIHTMKVDRHNVLFRAKVDAKSKKGLVKITASNRSNWGNTKLLQMIISGSLIMCHGVKGRGCVKKVRLLSLSDVASEAQLDCPLVEQRILDGMKDIQEQMKDAKEGQVYEATFLGTSGKLVLETRVSLLPSSDVVGELI